MAALNEDAEFERRKTLVAAGGTDRLRWSDPASYEAFWSDRSMVAARMLPGGRYVCDIGCGMQGLRQHLAEDSVYLPADLKSWTSEVLACDLNAGDFPVKYLAICDVVCLLGVIEYIYDLPRLFKALRSNVEGVLVSYNCTDFADVDRAAFGWVNALTSHEILDLLRQQGFEIFETRRVGSMEIVIHARQPAFSRFQRIRRCLRRKLR